MMADIDDEITVLHCLTYVYDGGQETFMVKTFKYITENSKRRFRFIICALVDCNNPDLEETYRKNNIELIGLNFSNRNRSITDLWVNFKQIIKLSSIIKKEKVEVLYGHDFFSALVVRLSYLLARLRFYRVPKVYISLHNLLYWLKKPHWYINRILAMITTKIICVSRSVMNYSRATDRIREDKYLVVYNGIDVNEFDYDDLHRKNIRKEYSIPESALVIGTVGSLSFRKGHVYLIDAFSKLIQQNKDSYLLIFGGSRDIDGDDLVRKNIYAMIEKSGLSSNIMICKPRLDINKVYSAFDLFVMPSVVEGFGLALAEAMACRRITIGSDIEPFKEIIEDKVNGFLFRSKDSDDLLKVLTSVLSLSSEVKNKISDNAREIIENRFSSNVMGKKYAELYEA